MFIDQKIYVHQRSLTVTCILCRVRFLLGGRHGEFKFLPPPGYAPCYEAVLPKEKLKVEHSREYKQERSYTRDLLGPTVSLTQAAFTPIPVDTSQVPRATHGNCPFCVILTCRTFGVGMLPQRCKLLLVCGVSGN